MKRASRFRCQQSEFCRSALITLGLALLPVAKANADDYRVDVGDVLELSVPSIPEFRYKATVGANGQVSFPLVGVIPAQNKSTNEILQVIQTRVPQKALRRRGQDGREYEIVIGDDEVSLAVAEFSPVYLNGDVSNPGSFPYRPGLTVRQAIALAGGYNIMRTRMENPYLLAADLRSQRETLLNDHAREQARIARLQSELGHDVKVSNMPEPSPTAVEVRALEMEQLDARRDDFEKERVHLTQSVQSLSANLSLLEKQMETEKERAKIDLADMIRVEGLAAKGMAPVTRLSDTRRLVLLSASRATEIEARTEQVRQRRAEEERKLQELFDKRRIELLGELEDAKMRFASIVSRLSAATEKMFLVGAIQSQIGRGLTGEPVLVIFRKTGSGAKRLVATEEMELLPRDVVEVALPVENLSTSDIQQPSRTQERLGALSNENQTR